jgi:hypothetical protein
MVRYASTGNPSFAFKVSASTGAMRRWARSAALSFMTSRVDPSARRSRSIAGSVGEVKPYITPPLGVSAHDSTEPSSPITTVGLLPSIGTRYRCELPRTCTTVYIDLPSGAQRGARCRLSIAWPNSRRFEPSAFMIQTCVSSIVVSDDVSSRFVPRYAIVRPSGDQTGWYSALRVFVSWRMAPDARLRANTS